MILIESLQFQVKFEDIVPINENFSKCKIYTLSIDENRNGSFISKDAVEKSLPSIFNIPIVGEYLEEENNFGGHGGKIEISDGDVKFVNTTKPYGVIPESAKIYWENVQEDDGTVAEYLVVEDAILWTGRYPEIGQLLDYKFGQSMELDINVGNWEEIDNKKLFVIDDFTFSALCILGIDKDGLEDSSNGHIEPCFPSASISAYSFAKDVFTQEFKQMMKELKFSIDEEFNKSNKLEKGGKHVDELNQLLEKYNLSLEDLSAKEINHEDYSLEELEVKLQEFTKKESQEEVPADEVVNTFSLTSEQLEDELKRILSQNTLTDDWGWEYPAYYFVDYMPDQSVVVAFDCEDGYLVGFNYTVEGDLVSVDMSVEQRFKVDYVPMDLPAEVDNDVVNNMQDFSFVPSVMHNHYKENLKEFETIKSQLTTVESELTDLRQFKANIVKEEKESALNAVFESFADKLTEDEMSPLRNKMESLEVDGLKKELFALVGEKMINNPTTFSKKEEKQSNKIPLFDETKKDSPYGDLFEKYLGK